ncbi:MAG: hypothetical protein NC124_13280 [Clostridium sp.]|nr:hypothetical protein [Clostridium sp.]
MWGWIVMALAAWIVTGKYIDWIRYNLAMQLFGYIIPYALILLWGIVIENKKVFFEKFFIVERCLGYLSKASYSIFLTHFIALQILMMDWGITGKLWILYKAVTPVILIAIGCLGYQFIEKPLNRVFNKR